MKNKKLIIKNRKNHQFRFNLFYPFFLLLIFFSFIGTKHFFFVLYWNLAICIEKTELDYFANRHSYVSAFFLFWFVVCHHNNCIIVLIPNKLGLYVLLTIYIANESKFFLNLWIGETNLHMNAEPIQQL